MKSVVVVADVKAEKLEKVGGGEKTFGGRKDDDSNHDNDDDDDFLFLVSKTKIMIIKNFTFHATAKYYLLLLLSSSWHLFKTMIYTILLTLTICLFGLTESSECFPTPLLPVWERGTTYAAWATSGPPQRPSSQRHGIVTFLTTRLTETKNIKTID